MPRATNHLPEPLPMLDAILSDNHQLRKANGELMKQLRGHQHEVERLRVEVERRDQSTAELDVVRGRLEALTDELEDVSAALVRSKQEFGQLAKVASHDLRAPMRTMGQYVQLLMKRLSVESEPKQQEYLDHILDGSERMNALMRDLLTYSRVVTAQPQSEPVDCNQVLQVVTSDVQAILDQSDGEIIRIGSLPEVQADPFQIEQLFQHVIDNALKFRSSVPPRVVVSAEREDRGWTIAFADNGIGIEPKYHERVFRIFQRLHTRDEYPGTGIGLAIVKRIVEHHQGSASIISQGQEGTTVRVHIPR